MKDVKAEVRRKYGRIAAQVAQGKASCCGEACADPVSSNIYGEGDTRGLPRLAVKASLGCGNPVALAELRPGQDVLDLGSGGGIDALMAAKRVGPEGKVYGLDMSDEMLALARRNRAKAKARNVEFLRGEIEKIPLPDASVDVILSNCVINLSADKPRVVREMYRVLRPGGRVAVHDVVVRGRAPAAIRRSVEAWIGCIAGALEESRYRTLLRGAGFGKVRLKTTRVLGSAASAEYRSAFVSAVKPAAKASPRRSSSSGRSAGSAGPGRSGRRR